MGVSWTREQQQVIDLRKRNILVSAAAGSGKTAVLVERIIKMITEGEHPVDIDRLLVVTFTNAAAAEMRERIGAAIEKALEEHPDSEHLQRQLTLIHNAQITTIDSFCLYVIRNHFHEIDLEPDFRIGDEGELKLLKEDVLRGVLESNYEQMSPEFAAFAKGYVSGKSDAKVAEMILSLYEFSMSYPWPMEWLTSGIRGYEIPDVQKMAEAPWMQPLVLHLRSVLADLVKKLRIAHVLTLEENGPDVYEKVIASDLAKFEELAACKNFLELYEKLTAVTYDRLPSSRGFSGDAGKLSRVKELRDQVKDTVKKINKQYFFASPEVMCGQVRRAEPMAKELVRLAIAFSEAFAAEKRRKNLVDFHDLEHFALEILVDAKTKQARAAAEEFRDMYEEIMIDEYQDSNHVQETLLRAISREERGAYNLFMVGDVKQSIYRFRLARPELFMEKYDTYTLEESSTQRIDLHRNFRSRSEVLDLTNDVCYRIMARDLGNVAYDEDAALYAGADYCAPDEAGMFAPEILVADSAEELLEGSGYEDRKLYEAKLVAERIRKLMTEQKVTDKATGELRAVRYSDIVILLRSLSGYADSFAAVLNEAGLPAHTVSATGYFSAVEVQTVLAMLRILDNPRQDIPLAAVLKSPIAGLTDEELGRLRAHDRSVPFCECVLARCRDLAQSEEPLAEGYEKKLWEFWKLYERLRALVPDTPIHELIEIVLKESGYGNYAAAMPAGARRRANLRMLVEKAIAYENTSYKGLFHFVRYIDELQKYDVDFGEADMVGENEDVVRIMSIHKSKGLEFPVVFVCGLGRNFNKQDTRSRMVLHPELGIGIDWIDGERRIKTPTILKRAIAKQIELENLGEELRVLYVALTRAKEKLILTGCRKEAENDLAALREAAQEELFPETEHVPLPYLLRESAAGYFDWLLPAVFSYHGRYQVRVVPAEELLDAESRHMEEETENLEQCLSRIAAADAADVAEFDGKFSFTYPYERDLERKNKYSVSELKHRAMREKLLEEETDVVPAFLETEGKSYVPPFVQKKMEQEETGGQNQGALRGTAVHRVMECYQFSAAAGVTEQIEAMLAGGQITEEMKRLVKPALIETFLTSAAGERMKRAETAGTLYREKPFVMGFTGEELAAFGFGDGEDSADDKELTLIQGIIDVFWIEEDGIVVLDYKTDRVKTGKELADRYASQLKLYGEALERIYNHGSERTLRVKERLLYSFRLGAVIPV